MRPRVLVLLVLPVAGAVLAWLIGSAWYEALEGTESRATMIFWTVLLLSVPVALLGEFLVRREGPRGLGVLAAALSVLLVALSFAVILLLYPPS